MYYDFLWPVFGVFFLFGLAALVLIAGHLRASRKIQLRAIQKEERLKAIEAGVPLPEVDEGEPMLSTDEQFAHRVRWLRLVALAVGYFMLFSGIGMVLAFHLSSDYGLQEISSIGVLPALAGVGLLLFHWVTRKQV